MLYVHKIQGSQEAVTVWEFLQLVEEGVVWDWVKAFLARISKETVLGLYCMGACLCTHPDTDQSK